jgi:uronate dehydrogenase
VKLLLTGAAGDLGSALRSALRGRYELLRLSDIRPITDVVDGEAFVSADATNLEQMRTACAGIDCLLHFAGIPWEDTWEHILAANMIGTYNAFEAARLEGVKRVVYASSNHVIGFRRSDETVGLDALPRPDSRYGVSKVFGEALGRLYADKYAMSVVSLRLGSVRVQPEDVRQLATWISHRDTAELVRCSIETPDVHYEVLYGASANPRNRWSNAGAERFGYAPKDNAEDYVAEVAGKGGALDEVARTFHGGPFCAVEFAGHIASID